MRFIAIMFHTALIIWIGLTFVRDDNFEHWLQLALIFVNSIMIGWHLEQRFTGGFKK